MTSLSEFFELLYRDTEGLIELRPLPGRGEFWPNGIHESEIIRLVEQYLDQHRNCNCYFGVGTRDGRGGGKVNLVNIPSVWCDRDLKITPGDEQGRLLAAFPYKPSITVATGGGHHDYWLLKEPATRDDIDRLEDVNRRIAAALGADMNSIDAARILRIPGTRNLKRDFTVAIERCEALRYSLEDFLEILPPPPVAARPASSGAVDMQKLLPRVFRCHFLRWCYKNQSAVPEPLWYAMLSNLARVSPGGITLCHLFSQDHPTYNRARTDAKILHALDSSGPVTCPHLRSQGFSGCGACKSKTPLAVIVTGRL